MLIGIHGFKQAGKDTLADLLVREYDFRKVAFADRVKEAVAAAFGVPRKFLWGGETGKQTLTRIPWADFRGIRRRERAHPEFLTVRELLQTFATEMCRDKLPGIWYRYLPLEGRRVVVSDVRFPDEASFLKGRGAFIVRVLRPGREPGEHASESGLPQDLVDHTLVNGGSLARFKREARWMCADLGLRKIQRRKKVATPRLLEARERPVASPVPPRRPG